VYYIILNSKGYGTERVNVINIFSQNGLMKGEKQQKVVFEQTSKILISYQKESKITHFSTS
jgi:hypothetical protein